MDNGIQSLVVHVDGPRHAAERLQLARRVALEHGACVTVVYASAPLLSVMPLDGDAGGQLALALEQLDEERRAGARAAFQSVLRQPGPVRADFVELAGDDVGSAVARQAMCADLAVLGQHEPGRTEPGGVPSDFVERVLLGSGRAALVVPYVGAPTGAFTTVLIAWKETPECARAVAAALPILRKAARVHVVAWGGSRPRLDRPGLDLVDYLKMHGVSAQWHDRGPEPGPEVGELLLSAAADLQADLLVMGCYGHGRAREWVLGGASRTVLQAMTLPVLMSH